MAALVRVSDINILLNLAMVEVLIVVLFGLRDTGVRYLASADLLLGAIVIHSFA